MSELNNIWDNSWDTFGKDIGKASSKFRQEPINATDFFRDYLHTPLFPRQQRIVDAVFTDDFQDISTLKNEFYIGHGKRCIAATTKLKDEITKEIKTVKEWATLNRTINIKSLKWNNVTKRHKTIITKSGVPFKKGNTELFKVTTKSNLTIIVSKEHLFKTTNGWEALGELKLGDKILVNQSTTNILSNHKEVERINKIKLTMKGQKKSKKHVASFKKCVNLGRFEKGKLPWNKGKINNYSEETRFKMGSGKRNKKESLITRIRKSIANKRLKHHTPDCVCSCCKTMRNETRFVCKPHFYKGLVMHSSWETRYAEYLDRNSIVWKYEPKMFTTSEGGFIPDFYLPETKEFIEIKGYLRETAKLKLNAFRKEFPSIKLTVLFEDDLKLMGII